jgi:hypothetical protein
MANKTCFVVMGFGMKTDYTNVTLHEIRRLGEYGPVCCTKLGDSANELHLIRRPAILCTLRDFSWKK